MLSDPLEQFYITLPSSTFGSSYLDNALSHYSTPINPSLNLGERSYEVALVEISGTTRMIKNITSEDNASLVFRFKLDKQIIIKNYTLPSGHYSSTLSVFKALNVLLLNDTTLKHLEFVVVDRSNGDLVDLNDNCPTTIHDKKLYLHLNPRRGLLKPEDSTILDSSVGVRFTGIPNKLFNKQFNDYSLGMFNPGVLLLDINRISNIRANTLYVYTNIIEHQYVGNSMSKLLRNVIIRDINKMQTTGLFQKEFVNPHYVRVEGSLLRVIDIDIRLVTGDYAPFADGELLVKLHFRSVKNDD